MSVEKNWSARANGSATTKPGRGIRSLSFTSQEGTATEWGSGEPMTPSTAECDKQLIVGHQAAALPRLEDAGQSASQQALGP